MYVCILHLSQFLLEEFFGFNYNRNRTSRNRTGDYLKSEVSAENIRYEMFESEYATIDYSCVNDIQLPELEIACEVQ